MKGNPKHPCDVLIGVLERYHPLYELAHLVSVCSNRGDVFETQPPLTDEMAGTLFRLGHDLAAAKREIDDWFETMAPPNTPGSHDTPRDDAA